MLYVVRAATKFSFAFGKTAKRAINVTGFSLKKAVKDRMYLMPHCQQRHERKILGGRYRRQG